MNLDSQKVTMKICTLVLAAGLLMTACRVQVKYELLIWPEKEKPAPVVEQADNQEVFEIDALEIVEPLRHLRRDWIVTSRSSELSRNVSCFSAATRSGGVVDTGLFSGAMTFDRRRGEAYVMETSGDGEDIYVAMHDKTGRFLWAQSIFFDGEAGPVQVSTSVDGNVFLMGWYLGSIAFPRVGLDPQVLSGSNSMKNVFLACYGEEGQLRWTRNIEHYDKREKTTNHAGRAIESTLDGGVIVSGEFIEGLIFSPNEPSRREYLTNSAYHAGFIVKYDKDGALQWVRIMKGAADSGVYCLKTLPGGDFYGGGGVHRFADIDQAHGTPLEIRNPLGGRSLMLLHLDEKGFGKSAHTIGAKASYSNLTGLDFYQNEDIAVGGYYKGTLVLKGRNTMVDVRPSPGNNNYAACVARMNKAGGIVWSRDLKSLGGSPGAVVVPDGIYVDQDDCMYVLAYAAGGLAVSVPGQTPLVYPGKDSVRDYFLLTFSPEGDLMRAMRVGSDKLMSITGLAPLPDGKGLYLTGYYGQEIHIVDEMKNKDHLKTTGETERLIIRYFFEKPSRGWRRWF